MTILHIASISNSPFGGVCVVAPQHVLSQGRYATVAMLNISGVVIDVLKGDYVDGYEKIPVQLPYIGKWSLDSLPSPFCKPDMVVIHELYYIELLRISCDLRRRGIPYVIIPHGELQRLAQRRHWLKKKVANWFLFNRMVRGAAAVQFLSPSELEHSCCTTKGFIGTNGIDIPEYYKQQFSTQGTRFLYVGRYDMFCKGLDILVEAVAIQADFLRANGCTVELHGNDIKGRRAVLMEKVQECGVGDLIIEGGPVVGQDKINTLLHNDVFVQTSRFEGMPMGLLEAMGYGLPVLITEGTTLGGFVADHDCGWVAYTESKAVANALRKAVEQREEWANKGKRGRVAIGQQFAWEKVAQAAISEYERIVG
ncbi:MAG: glycosyltransferase [Bacteroidales bacterium]|nr:glycosyltransferase [Bacteroidales bacterium]